MSRSKSYPLQLTVLAVLGLLSSSLLAAPSTTPQVRPAADPDPSALPQGHAPAKACEAMNLACGEIVTGRLDDSKCHFGDGMRSDVWNFSGRAGDSVEINLISDDFDTQLALVPPDRDMVTKDDDGGVGTNSRITRTLDDTGRWGIHVINYMPHATGDYALRLECVKATRPATPTLLHATALSSTEIELHWQDNSDNENVYAVLNRPGGCSAFEEIGTVPGDSTRAIVFGLHPDTPYDFRVVARGDAGDSLVSNTVSATTLAATGVCQASDTVLCLRGGRFRVESGRIGLEGYLPGFIVSENEGSAVTYFSSDTKWELMVNIQPRAGRYWFSAAGLTEGREYDIYVTDLVTGEWWTYTLPEWNPRVTNAALSQMTP